MLLIPVLATLAVLLTACSPAPSPPAPTLGELLASATLVDLTHPLDEETLVWPTSIPFSFETTFEGHTDGGYFYLSRNLSGPEHGGTHLDAPVHFAEGRWSTEEIPLERLMGPGVVVDVSGQAAEDPDYQVRVANLEEWERLHGPIPEGAILLLRTDRSRHWGEAEPYMGTARRGEEGVAELSFPGLHPDAARWLVDNRSISAVGIDTPSIDHGPSSDFMSHRILFEENIVAFENVAHLDRLPPAGSTIVALPMKLVGGSGGPLRIIGIVGP